MKIIPGKKPEHTKQPSQDGRFFFDLYDQAPLPYQSLDGEGKILAVNQAWCELLGYLKEEVIGTPFADYIVPHQKQTFKNRFNQFKETGSVKNVEFELIHKDGSSVFISGTGKIVYSDNRQVKRTHCILVNISDRVHYEKKFNDSQQFYKALFENNLEVILLIDPDSGKIIRANDAACIYYGYSLDEITQLNISQINTLSFDDIKTKMNKAHQLDQNVFYFKHRLSNGDYRDVEVFSGPIEVNNNKLLYSIVRDISRQKNAEDEVERMGIAMRERLIALTQPIGKIDHLKFEDLFNIEDIQGIQDAFSQATGVASLITDINGYPITKPSGFCRLCEIIRQTEIGRKNCFYSDSILGKPGPDGVILQPCLSGGLLDAGTHISVGDHPVANWLIGQVWDVSCDPNILLEYGREIGADMVVFEAAIQEIPRMPRSQFENIGGMLYKIANQLSKLAIQNVQQARVIIEREQANLKLVRINSLYKVANSINQNTSRVHSPEDLFQMV
ncbi:MAG: PocR ligand-binding domain-containing protein, partial [Anaerolineae bacterium]|nr:PocR ligand-binding domain-containing protein [Anaerolineae bacterium]